MSDSEEEDVEPQLKFIVVGDGSSGKTSLITRYCQDQFAKQYDQTVGVDFYLKRVKLPGTSATLQIWDIGGQTLGGKMLDKYVFGAQGVLFVYDLTNYSSFQNIDDWMQYIKDVLGDQSKVKYPAKYSLVANKGDLEHLRTVSKSKHDAFAAQSEMSSFVVSAKTGDSVAMCFKKVAADILNIKLSKTELDTSTNIVRAEVIQMEEPSGGKGPSDRGGATSNSNKPGRGGANNSNKPGQSSEPSKLSKSKIDKSGLPPPTATDSDDKKLKSSVCVLQ